MGNLTDIWICCQCFEAPMLIHLYEACISCGHWRCAQCRNDRTGSAWRRSPSLSAPKLRGSTSDTIPLKRAGVGNTERDATQHERVITNTPEDGTRGGPASDQKSQVGRRDLTIKGMSQPMMTQVKMAVAAAGVPGNGSLTSTQLKVYWELLQFIRDDYWGEHALGSALTITGEVSFNAWAGSCSQYVEATWGTFGLEVLHDLELALARAPPATRSSMYLRFRDWAVPLTFVLASRCVFHLCSIDEEILRAPTVVDFQGTLEEICALGQLLSWITATFRRPHPDKLSTSTVVFVAPSGGAPFFSVRMLPLIFVYEGLSLGSCWHPLFPSTVMASGFPVPHRPDGAIGIQLGFDVMLDLSMALYHVDLREANNRTQGIFFRGLTSMLFPTRYADKDVIQWHFVPDIETLGLKKHDTPDKVPLYTWLRVRDLDTLRSATAILGYCGDGVIRLGTEERAKIYPDLESSLTSKETPAPEGSVGVGTVQVNAMGFGGAQVSGVLKYRRGLADAMLSAEKIAYKELLDASKDSVIVFETEPKMQMAWLVPRVSVILDLVNHWAQRYKDADQTIEYAEATSDGAEAAKAVLARPDYSNLPLLSGDPGTDPVRVCDLVRRFYGQMQRRECISAQSERGAKGTTEFKRNRLVGWDLKEFICTPLVVHRRQFNEKLSASWRPLTRDAPVYFGQGLGELISPQKSGDVCRPCKSNLTQGGLTNNILITSVRCILAMSKQNGFNDCCVISDNLLWKFSNESVFDGCGKSNNSCPKQFQVLVQGKHSLVQLRQRRADGTFYPRIYQDGIIAFRDPRQK